MVVRPATDADVGAIGTLLAANAADTSLFQQPERQVRRTLADFRIAVDHSGGAAGCGALKIHRPGNVEILAIAVDPARHGAGIGRALVRALIDEALGQGADSLWLATAKPDYFARFDFTPFSKWSLPAGVLATKVGLIFQQPPRRWLPALFGRHTFMRHATAVAGRG